jgi:hypothetical protein
VTELESLKVIAEAVEFRFVHKKTHLAVIVQFDEPTGSGQFARARVTVGFRSMIVKFKPGRFKPRVADCKELASICLDKNGRLRTAAEAVSLLFGTDRLGFVQDDNNGTKKKTPREVKQKQGAVGVRFELQELN